MALSIAHKLTIGFGSTLALLAVAGGVGVWGLGRVSESAERLDAMVELVSFSGQAATAGQAVAVAASEVMRLRNDEAVRGYDEAYASFDGAVERLIGAIEDPSLLKLAEDLEGAGRAYDAAFDPIGSDLTTARKTVTSNLHKMNIGLRGEFDKLVQSSGDGVDAGHRDEIEAAAREYYNGLVSAKYYLAVGDATDLADARRLLAASLSRLEGLEKSELDSAVGGKIASIRGTLVETIRVFGEVTAMNERGEAAARSALTSASTRFGEAASALDAAMNDAAEALETQGSATASTAMTATLGAAGAALVVGIGFAFAIGRSLSSRMSAMRGEIGALTTADGRTDLTKRITVSGGDEVAQIAESLNGTLSRMQVLIGEVGKAATTVAAASQQMTKSANGILGGLTQQQGQTEQVAAAIEEMSASIAEVADQGTSAAGAARSSGEDAQNGGKVVRETVEQIQAIAAEVGESSRVVSELGAKGQQIGEIIAVINDIADQTNLLALNAAIEAARAGEHGRGFAVVADEVRKLAERTTSATEEVSRSIREIQDGTSTAVEKIEASAGRVGKGVELAGSAGAALDSIVQSSSGLMRMVEAIAAAAQQQSAASEEITRSVAEIRMVSGQSARSAEEVAEATAAMDGESRKLAELVARVRV